MNTADKNGRPWAKVSELKKGQTVELDGGFTCRGPGPARVYSDAEGRLYFECSHGNHYFCGQDDGGHCVGIYGVVVVVVEQAP